MHLKLTCWLFICGLLTMQMACTQAISSTSDTTMTMSPAEFHDTLTTRRRELRIDGQSPEPLQTLLFQRLEGHFATLDASVTEVVNAFSEFEGDQDDSRYALTLNVLDKLLAQQGLQDRTSLRSLLWMRKAQFHEVNDDKSKAITCREAAQLLLVAEHLNVDVARMQNMVQLAYNLLQKGAKTKAEPLFLDVLSYPWTLVESAGESAVLRDLYIEAGKGLILCRHGDLPALQEIYFVPAADEELQPVLQSAVEAAK